MAKTINLTQLRINTLHADYNRLVVIVSFSILDDAGTEWVQNEATFWVNQPADIAEHPEWFVIGEPYISQLIGLRDAALAALIERFLA